jgi:hypothetical protein
MDPPLKLGNFGGKSSRGSERPIFGPRGWHNRLTDRHNQPRLESRCRVVRKSLRGHFERASRYSQKTQEQTIAQTQTKTKDDGIPPMLDRRNGKATPSYEELLAQIEALKAQVAHKSTLTLKVAKSGGVSLYGLGRYPITMYQAQWLKVLAMSVQRWPRRGLRSPPRVEASGTAAHSL